MDSQTQDDSDLLADLGASFNLLRDPYPFFAAHRTRHGVFDGSVMDWSKTPDEFRPQNQYAAVSYDAVNTIFRDSKSFNSKIYDVTIGLCFPIGCLLVAGVMLALVKLPRVAAPADTTKLVRPTNV